MNVSSGRTRTYSFITIFILLLALGGCGYNTTKLTKRGGISNQIKTDLKISWWGSQVRHEVTIKAINLYQEEHPDITFKDEYSSYNDYWNTLRMEEAANDAPDIIQMDASYLTDYASRGLLADLSNGILTGDLDHQLLDSGKYKGKLYAIAAGNNAFGIAYNKIALEKLGIQIPESGWTWDTYFNLAKKIQPHLEQGHYAIPDNSTDVRVYQTYQLAMGKGDIAKSTFAFDKSTWVSWEKTYAELQKAGVVPPPKTEASDMQYDPKQDLLLNGTVLFRPMFAADFQTYSSMRPDTFALATIPSGIQSGGYMKPSMFWTINGQSKHIDQAKEFIDWIIHDQKAAEIVWTSRGIPVSNTVLEEMKSQFTDADQEQLNLIKKTEKNANPFHPGPDGLGNFEGTDYKQITQNLEFNHTSYDQVFQELKKKFYDDVT